ncbi:NmrA family NAD(P)-binding protein [Pedobacter sp. ISL-68]|uniref:NmrA family NAD(P)-binding protein n=1 Tax=unclassified Pedobacter TaxID=2628915 RepID=UPI001BE69152|nr:MULTISPECIES: NmrA family NAD(P)-binding protein [unclassified Pedobacter]MBT2561143.1 NmrA family NAD(P)-binding protein [Pedobacter sp. ISL-64]MBT2590532.1 NmrA family NAD(P)-binding protein [Pedobacter sp. ISL-68]
MKITLTGSVGNITKPLAEILVAKGHEVKIISSNTDRTEEIKLLGAIPLIGSVSDTGFLKDAFTGSDAIYTMVPPNFAAPKFRAYIKGIGENYAAAIKESGVKKVVNLSSVGADLPDGTGPIAGLHDVENIFATLNGVDVRHLRAGYFYINFLANIDMVKHANILGSNFGADSKLVLVHPRNIAEVAAEVLESNFTGKTIQYVASDDESTPSDVAKVLGTAVGKPELPWIEFSGEDAFNGMVGAGLPEEIAKNYVEMGDAIRSNKLFVDYYKNRPILGSIKLKDFADEFAAAYQN